MSLPNPYYQDDFVTLYHGDCLEIMKEMEPGSVDAVVTDPPYGINYQSHRVANHLRYDRINNDDRTPHEFMENIDVALDGAIYIFTRWDVMDKWRAHVESYGFRVKSCLVWDRVVHGMGDLNGAYAPCYDMCLFVPMTEHRFRRTRPKDVLRFMRVGSNEAQHPTEKPVDLIMELINNSSDINDTILDPFLGSGTTAVAAKNLGRKCIGIELEEKYLEIAVRRLAQEPLPLGDV